MLKAVQWSVNIIVIIIIIIIIIIMMMMMMMMMMIIIIIIVVVVLSLMIIIIGFTCPPSIRLKLTKCNKCYYIVRKVLQSGTGTQSVTIITKCDRKDPR